MNFITKSIDTILNLRGEELTRKLIDGFSCRHNLEIDGYLRHRAVEFTLKSMTVTHLVFDGDSGLFVGYFALTHKPLTFHVGGLSGSQKRRIERFSKLDPETGTYTVSAFLIAQIGKNYMVDGGKLISGSDLIDLAKEELLVAKAKIGGQVVFVEMEHGNSKLAKFYTDNGFVLFGTRDDFENGRPVTYDQMFLFLK